MRTTTLLLLTLVGASLSSTAATVYKTVDADGHVSYSDQPPKAGAEAERIEIPAYQPARSEEDAARVDAMREVTERMREDRLERERVRAEAAARQYYPPPAEQRSERRDSDYWVPLYYPLYPRWPHRPPVARPPLRPKPHTTSNPFPPRNLKAPSRPSRGSPGKR